MSRASGGVLRPRILGLTLLTIGSLVEPASAQESGGAACFRGRPLPECRSFWITEASGGVEYVDGRAERYVAADVGWMRNVTDRTAVGATIGVGHNRDFFVAVRPRLRRWVTPKIGLDIGPGVRWTPGRIETIEVLGGVSISDWAGVVVGPTYDLGQSGFGFLAAGRASSYGGLAAYLGGLIAATIYIITFPSS